MYNDNYTCLNFLSFVSFPSLYSVMHLQQNVVIIFLQLYFLILVHLMLGLIFIHSNLQSTIQFDNPFPCTKCIYRNNAQKNLHPWKKKPPLRKFILFAFLANIAHLADNFIELCILKTASFWKFIIWWLQHHCLATYHKEKLWGL